MSTPPPAGWYPMPEDPARLRWWDGNAWTEFYAPNAPASAPKKAGASKDIAGGWRPSKSTWVIGGFALLAALIYGFTVGFGAALVILALFAIPTAIVALISRRPTWLGFRGGRRWPGLALVAAFLALIVGGVSSSHSTGPSSNEASSHISLADYTGVSGTSASKKLDAAGLTVRMVTDDGSAAPADWSGWTVVAENPPAGTHLQPDATVTITLHAPDSAKPSPSPSPSASQTASAAPEPSASPSQVATAPVPLVAPAPAAPAPAEPAPAAPAAPASPTITPGAFCADSQNGQVAQAANGHSYQCGGHGPDANGHLHWNTM